MERFYLRRNDTEECWELIERNAVPEDDHNADALLARFYDGNAKASPIAQYVLRWLEGTGAESLAMVGY
jgi:hypothetical protein